MQRFRVSVEWGHGWSINLKSERLEILLILLVIVGGGYFALQYFMRPSPQVMCGPLKLSPEVKAYIDQKMKDPGAAEDLTRLNQRLADFETKFKTLDQQAYLAANEAVEKRRLFISEKVREQKLSTQQVVDAVRNAELNRLRQETALTCANVTTVRSTYSRGRQRDSAPANPNGIEDFSPIPPAGSKPDGAAGGQ